MLNKISNRRSDKIFIFDDCALPFVSEEGAVYQCDPKASDHSYQIPSLNSDRFPGK